MGDQAAIICNACRRVLEYCGCIRKVGQKVVPTAVINRNNVLDSFRSITKTKKPFDEVLFKELERAIDAQQPELSRKKCFVSFKFSKTRDPKPSPYRVLCVYESEQNTVRMSNSLSDFPFVEGDGTQLDFSSDTTFEDIASIVISEILLDSFRLDRVVLEPAWNSTLNEHLHAEIARKVDSNHPKPVDQVKLVFCRSDIPVAERNRAVCDLPQRFPQFFLGANGTVDYHVETDFDDDYLLRTLTGWTGKMRNLKLEKIGGAEIGVSCFEAFSTSRTLEIALVEIPALRKTTNEREVRLLLQNLAPLVMNGRSARAHFELLVRIRDCGDEFWNVLQEGARQLYGAGEVTVNVEQQGSSTHVLTVSRYYLKIIVVRNESDGSNRVLFITGEDFQNAVSQI